MSANANTQCAATRSIPSVPGAPRPGKIYKFLSPATNEVPVDLKNGTPATLNAPGNYEDDITVLVQGEWTTYYVAEDPHNPPRCALPIAAALTFQSEDKQFQLTTDAGIQIVRSLTRHDQPGARKTRTAAYADKYIIKHWPAQRQLLVRLAGTPNDQICPDNIPLILVWQPSVINIADPFEATQSDAPYGIRR